MDLPLQGHTEPQGLYWSTMAPPVFVGFSTQDLCLYLFS